MKIIHHPILEITTVGIFVHIPLGVFLCVLMITKSRLILCNCYRSCFTLHCIVNAFSCRSIMYALGPRNTASGGCSIICLANV